MKKKSSLSEKDNEDWKRFLEDSSEVPNKDQKYFSDHKNKKFRFDLHGLSLDEANNKVREIIISCSKRNFKEVLLITGKGLHSSKDDVYKSPQLSKLRYSVPEFIKTEPEIFNLISSVKTPSQKDGGEGALLIKLKKFKE